jgi:predicted Zn-dependent protease
MDAMERNQVFSNALKAYREGSLRYAAAGFRRVIEDGSEDPRHLSYCGLLMAIGEGKVREGLELCENALEKAFYDPEMYLNLAKLHFLTGWRSRAVHVLRQGLRVDPNDNRLHRELQRIDFRSKPAFSFLGRNHPVNKYVGRVKTRLSRKVRGAGRRA